MLLGRLLRNFVRFSRAKINPLANRALFLGYEVERQVDESAKEDEEKPIEILGWYDVAIAKVAELGCAHLFYLLVI